MFCQKCGAQLDANAQMCESCNTRTSPMKFCQKCGETMPEEATVCPSCRTGAAVPSTPLQWLSLGLAALAFVTFGILGGDPEIYEVNIFDYLTIPISAAALVSAFVTIPRGRTVLKVISIILSAFFLVGSIGWVLM